MVDIHYILNCGLRLYLRIVLSASAMLWAQKQVLFSKMFLENVLRWGVPAQHSAKVLVDSIGRDFQLWLIHILMHWHWQLRLTLHIIVFAEKCGCQNDPTAARQGAPRGADIPPHDLGAGEGRGRHQDPVQGRRRVGTPPRASLHQQEQSWQWNFAIVFTIFGTSSLLSILLLLVGSAY